MKSPTSYFQTARCQEALELNQQTRDALDRNGRGGTLAKTILMVNQSSLLYRMGKIESARKIAAEAAQRMRSLRGTQPLTCASKIYLAAGDTVRSTVFAKDALAAAERIARKPAASADVGQALLALGNAQQAQGDASAATTLARANETLRNAT